MRTVTAPALAQIQEQYGTQPIFVIVVYWNSGSYTTYTDTPYGGFQNKILSLSDLDNVVAQNSNTSASISVSLDDTDDTIRTILKTTDIHKKKCEVYQVYADLAWDDRILLFKGEINSPIVWNEGSRSLSFDIISEIEGEEVGFSPEEGQFDFVSSDEVGKPWPLGFGHVVHVPAKRVKHILTGELKDYICYVDPILEYRMDALKQAYAESQLILEFFRAAAVGADSLCPPVVTVIQMFCAAILAEDYYTNLIIDTDAAIAFMLDYFDTYPAERVNYPADATNEALAFELISNLMIPLSTQKEYVKWLSDVCQWCYKVKQEAFQRQIDALNEIYYIYTEFMNVVEEICRELQYFRTEIEIGNGYRFPQATPTDIIINNVKWNVTFEDDLCTYVAGPLALYTNLAIDATRPFVPDACGADTYLASINLFWLTSVDSTKLLKGMYCLVHSTYDNANHIVKVIEQDGVRCKFDLITKAEGTADTQLVFNKYELRQSISSGFPVWPGPFGPIPTSFGTSFGPHWEPYTFYKVNDALEPWIIGLLSTDTDGDGFLDTVHGINEDELETLLKLQKIYPSDIAAPFVDIPLPGPRDIYTILGEDIDLVLEVSGSVLPHWLAQVSPQEVPDDTFWEASPGDEVRSADDTTEVYVANILPSTIKSVMAYRKNDKGKRILMHVPSQYYVKNEAKNLGDITVTTITLYNALKTMPEEGWEDQIYVTYNSSVGPNVVEILEHLITTYTDKSIDATSFDSVKALFRDNDDAELYPANFVLFDRKGALQQLDEIAWQARCSLKLASDTFYLTYLAAEPTTTVTLTEDDVEVATLVTSYTDTENIFTKLTAIWRKDYLPLEQYEEDEKIIIRYNVNNYAKHEEEIDFYIYNIEELVRKSATFWMIRYSNCWKTLELKTHLQHLDLETLDFVTLSFATDYVATGDVKARIEEARYNIQDNSVSMRLWLPVRIGEMTTYPYVWPASLTSGTVFPPVGDTDAGGTQSVIGNIND